MNKDLTEYCARKKGKHQIALQKELDRIERKKAKKKHRKRANRSQQLIRTSYKLGWIAKREDKYFHHPDYKRPFYGCFVSLIEHCKVHSKSGICPECYDYWPEIKKKYTLFRRSGWISRSGILTKGWEYEWLQNAGITGESISETD